MSEPASPRPSVSQPKDEKPVDPLNLVSKSASINQFFHVALTVLATSTAVAVMATQAFLAITFKGALVYYFEPNPAILILEVGLSLFSIGWLFWLAMRAVYAALMKEERH